MEMHASCYLLTIVSMICSVDIEHAGRNLIDGYAPSCNLKWNLNSSFRQDIQTINMNLHMHVLTPVRLTYIYSWLNIMQRIGRVYIVAAKKKHILAC